MQYPEIIPWKLQPFVPEQAFGFAIPKDRARPDVIRWVAALDPRFAPDEEYRVCQMSMDVPLFSHFKKTIPSSKENIVNLTLTREDASSRDCRNSILLVGGRFLVRIDPKGDPCFVYIEEVLPCSPDLLQLQSVREGMRRLKVKWPVRHIQLHTQHFINTKGTIEAHEYVLVIGDYWIGMLDDVADSSSEIATIFQSPALIRNVDVGREDPRSISDKLDLLISCQDDTLRLIKVSLADERYKIVSGLERKGTFLACFTGRPAGEFLFQDANLLHLALSTTHQEATCQALIEYKRLHLVTVNKDCPRLPFLLAYYYTPDGNDPNSKDRRGVVGLMDVRSGQSLISWTMEEKIRDLQFCLAKNTLVICTLGSVFLVHYKADLIENNPQGNAVICGRPVLAYTTSDESSQIIGLSVMHGDEENVVICVGNEKGKLTGLALKSLKDSNDVLYPEPLPSKDHHEMLAKPVFRDLSAIEPVLQEDIKKLPGRNIKDRPVLSYQPTSSMAQSLADWWDQELPRELARENSNPQNGTKDGDASTTDDYAGNASSYGSDGDDLGMDDYD